MTPDQRYAHDTRFVHALRIASIALPEPVLPVADLARALRDGGCSPVVVDGERNLTAHLQGGSIATGSVGPGGAWHVRGGPGQLLALEVRTPAELEHLPEVMGAVQRFAEVMGIGR